MIMKKIYWGMFFCISLAQAQGVWHVNEGRGLHGLKILHLGFQLGCIKDFEEVAQELGLDVTSWYILAHEIPKDFFDGTLCGNEVYNLTTERARRVWHLHKDFFEEFDVIITSDTAPLMRIFLENGWKKPLVVWICNRFDYSHYPSTTLFPDKAYYDLVRSTRSNPNVFLAPYSDFERLYAQARGVDVGTRVIRPVGSLEKAMRDGSHQSSIPTSIDKKRTLFLYPRFETDQQSTFILDECRKTGVPVYHGVYNGPKDIIDFKGVIYFPYQWSNIALFENIQRGIVHFVPRPSFIRRLAAQGHPIRDMMQLIARGPYQYCEWYREEFKDIFVYFDSWEELKEKMENINYGAMRTKIKQQAQTLRKKTLDAWRQLFTEVVHGIQR
jgi:hypothetical protein